MRFVTDPAQATTPQELVLCIKVKLLSTHPDLCETIALDLALEIVETTVWGMFCTMTGHDAEAAAIKWAFINNAEMN